MVVAAADAATELTIMSVAKPFVFALVYAALGPEEVRARVSVSATGLPFNSLEAVEHSDDGRTNPMVNPGAIATTSFVPGGTFEGIDGRSCSTTCPRFAGHPLSLDENVYRSASATNHANRSIASLLVERSRIAGDPDAALDLYTRQSAVAVTTRDLATMVATLADGA